MVIDEPALRDFMSALDEMTQELRLLRRHLEQRRHATRRPPPDPPEAREFLPWHPPAPRKDL
ncbi:MAG TPA: hypothetical protein VGF07_13200 [Stellaceae bacterium]|jgi:hypothetical protein